MVMDAAKGQSAIKGKAETYLPRPNPTDKSDENTKRYDQYLQRAVYYNATGRTENALIGMAIRRWPEVKLPAQLEPLLEDVNGAGLTIIQQAQAVLSDALTCGRAGLLTDITD